MPLKKAPSSEVQGGGPLGFGCGALIAVAIAGFFYLPTSAVELIVFAAIAGVGGLLGARYGDEFFTRIIDLFSGRW